MFTIWSKRFGLKRFSTKTRIMLLRMARWLLLMSLPGGCYRAGGIPRGFIRQLKLRKASEFSRNQGLWPQLLSRIFSGSTKNWPAWLERPPLRPRSFIRFIISALLLCRLINRWLEKIYPTGFIKPKRQNSRRWLRKLKSATTEASQFWLARFLLKIMKSFRKCSRGKELNMRF